MATPTPEPTATPAPGIDFRADATEIDAGDCTTVRCQVSNIDSVYLYREGEHWADHGVAGEGSRQICPSETTNYYVRVVMTDGTVETRKIKISVRPRARVEVAP